MIIGSIVFAVSAAALLADPSSFVTYIGVPSNESVVWSFRLTGVLLVALAIHMATTSRNAGDPAFRRAAVVMILVSIGLAVLTYLAPGTATTGRWVFVGIGSGFAALYVITLPIKSIGYKEEQPNSA
jgi:quinol-cytochrome oxidoreductase complex cytochrome b subunit